MTVPREERHVVADPVGAPTRVVDTDDTGVYATDDPYAPRVGETRRTRRVTEKQVVRQRRMSRLAPIFMLAGVAFLFIGLLWALLVFFLLEMPLPNTSVAQEIHFLVQRYVPPILAFALGMALLAAGTALDRLVRNRLTD